MPNRILRENILTSEAMATLGWAEEVFYRRLMSIVDDYGRHEAGHQLLRAKCYPLQTDSVRVADIARWMAACQKSGLILVYGVDGKQYLEIAKFDQRKRTESKYPPPSELAASCAQMSANARLGVCVVEGEGAIGAPPDGDDLFAGISPQIAKDFKAIRKGKKAAITKTAMDGIRREATKASLTLESALAMCCERGWASFKADWLVDGKNREPQSLPRLES